MIDLEKLFDSHTHRFDSKNRAIVQLNTRSEERPVLFSYGVHPMEKNYNLPEIERQCYALAKASGFLAIGEIGLDNRYDNAPGQEELYVFQLKLAKEFHKPVILHCVNCWDKCRSLHQKYAPDNWLVYHGFNKASMIQQVLNYPKSIVSIGESVLSNPKLQAVVQQLPPDRLLLETDMGKGELIDTYRAVAAIKKLSLHALTEQLDQNAKRIFNYE